MMIYQDIFTECIMSLTDHTVTWPRATSELLLKWFPGYLIDNDDKASIESFP